jgi:hypothetical protein
MAAISSARLCTSAASGTPNPELPNAIFAGVDL